MLGTPVEINGSDICVGAVENTRGGSEFCWHRFDWK